MSGCRCRLQQEGACAGLGPPQHGRSKTPPRLRFPSPRIGPLVALAKPPSLDRRGWESGHHLRRARLDIRLGATITGSAPAQATCGETWTWTSSASADGGRLPTGPRIRSCAARISTALTRPSSGTAFYASAAGVPVGRSCSPSTVRWTWCQRRPIRAITAGWGRRRPSSTRIATAWPMAKLALSDDNAAQGS